MFTTSFNIKNCLCLLSILLSFNSFSQAVQISGRCYYDANGNYVFDGGDSVLANREIQASYYDITYLSSTDDSGLYYLHVDTGMYEIRMIGEIDFENYDFIYDQHREYVQSGSDLVDFAFQKKDSIVSLISFIETPNENIPFFGGSRQYKLLYGYDGLLQNMPATVTLNFNPALTLIGSTPVASIVSSGKLQWNFEDVHRTPFGNTVSDSISIIFDYPRVGDTIGHFILSPDIIPGVTVTAPVHNYMIYDYFEKVDFPAPQPVGSTNGVKWLRHFSGNSNSYDECLSIDTTQNGDGYFIGAQKTVDYGSSNIIQSLPFIAKLNKDGLTVWEKYLVDFPANSLYTYLSAIKHTSDGGCLVLAGTVLQDSLSLNYDNAVVVSSFDSLGLLKWTTIINGSRQDEPGQNIVVLEDGSCLITGTTSSFNGAFVKHSFDTILNNVFMSKLSPTGAILFTRVYGGRSYDYGYKIIPLKNGSSLILAGTNSNDGEVVGAHQHFTIRPNGRDTLWSEEGWILNVNATGDIIWSKCYGGRNNSYFTGAEENNGGILLTGVTDSKDGDLPYYPEAFVPLWVLQISSDGSITWSKLHTIYKGYQDTNYVSFPNDIYDNYNYSSLHKTKDGNFMTAGIASDKYGPIRGKHGGGDFVFVKLDPAGDILWQKAVGGTGYENLNDIQLDRNDDILFVGSSTSDNDDLYQHSPAYNRLMVAGKIGITNAIRGQVFIDSNGNHIKDDAERFYSVGRINSVKRTDTITGYIFNGQFLNTADTGSYITTYVPANNYYTVYPAQHNSNFWERDLTDTVDFALIPAQGINDLEIQVTPLSMPRAGFNSTYRIITKNVGTTNINDVVIGFNKDNRQNFAEASRPFSGMEADSIWWGPFTLNAFHTDTLYVSFMLATPPVLNTGDTLSLKVVASPFVEDSSIVNNVSWLKEVVSGSLAANDKTEIHAGVLTTTQYAAGEYLQYQIRFQNTGTDTAFFITVKDTLPSKLDLNTIDIVSSSHPYTFRLDGNVVTWDFKNIKLPSNATDEPGSHGFISFKIKPKAGLISGDEFKNKAAIYFDYNLPLITGLHKTTLGAKPGICPNSNITYAAGISGNTYQWQVNTGGGFTDITDSEIYSGTGTQTLTLTAPASDMYGYRYRCVADNSIYSAEHLLKFAVWWNGIVSTAWEDAANWDCGILPDENTDVIIPAVVPYFPEVSSEAFCYSLQLSPGSAVTVSTGFNLTITGKAN